MTKCDDTGEIRVHESKMKNRNHQDQQRGVVLGVDGGATSTLCVCIPYFPIADPDDIPILGRAAAGCSNYNSVGESEAKDTLATVMKEALSESGSTIRDVQAICLGISGVNHADDQKRISNWVREIFPSIEILYVHNDAVAALASGTRGKLHGCVLISGTGSIAYGFTEDGREVRAGGGGPILGDWGSGYGIAAQALTAVLRAHDGRGPSTMLSSRITETLGLASPDEIIGWTYADQSWARIAAIVPAVVSCAEANDKTAVDILVEASKDLALCVKTVIRKLHLCGEDGAGSFPIVMVGGVLEANRTWDIANEVMKLVHQDYRGAHPIRPKIEPAVGAALLASNLRRKGAKRI